MNATPARLDVSPSLNRLRSDLCRSGSTPALPRGAVGAHAADGAPRYGYPEIAGYWLHWASARADVARERGEEVLAWLAETRQVHGRWPARTGDSALAPAYVQTRYLFDHAMLWHGLVAWATARDSDHAMTLATLAWGDALSFVDGRRLIAAHAPLHHRWSAAGGPFLLKACARLRHGDGVLAELATTYCAELTIDALARPHAEAHPQLYAIEGLLLLGHRMAAERALTNLIASHGGLQVVRESLGAGPRRIDVLAQLLRVALQLRTAARTDPDWAELAAEISARVDARGRLPLAGPGDDCPTWAQLFAEQALSAWDGATLRVDDLV